MPTNAAGVSNTYIKAVSERKGRSANEWPLRVFNNAFGILDAGLYIIRGPSKLGKTSIALVLAWHWALRNQEIDGRPLTVAMLSYEMPEYMLGQRLTSHVTGTEMSDLRLKGVEEARIALEVAQSRVGDRLIFDEAVQAEDVAAWLNGLPIKPHVLFVDYLQIMHTKKSGSLFERVSHVLEILRDVAKETGTAIIAIASENTEGDIYGIRTEAIYASTAVISLKKSDEADPSAYGVPVAINIEVNRVGPTASGLIYVDLARTRIYEPEFSPLPEGDAL